MFPEKIRFSPWALNMKITTGLKCREKRGNREKFKVSEKRVCADAKRNVELSWIQLLYCFYRMSESLNEISRDFLGIELKN